MVSVNGTDAGGPGSIPGSNVYTFLQSTLVNHKPVAGSIPAVRIATLFSYNKQNYPIKKY